MILLREKSQQILSANRISLGLRIRWNIHWSQIPNKFQQAFYRQLPYRLSNMRNIQRFIAKKIIFREHHHQQYFFVNVQTYGTSNQPIGYCWILLIYWAWTNCKCYISLNFVLQPSNLLVLTILFLIHNHLITHSLFYINNLWRLIADVENLQLRRSAIDFSFVQ